MNVTKRYEAIETMDGAYCRARNADGWDIAFKVSDGACRIEIQKPGESPQQRSFGSIEEIVTSLERALFVCGGEDRDE